MNSEKVQQQFQERVLRGADEAIDEAVSVLVDWFIERNLSPWEDVMDYTTQRTRAGDVRIVGSVGGRSQCARASLVESMRQRISPGIVGYNRCEEAVHLAGGQRTAAVCYG